ncbi:MAG: OB-fold domain-containing protein [Novosphingobium sp.]|nr:OB-fold domain-containing protein [Novosphingobium sp.]
MTDIPLPNISDPLTAPHWEAAREGRMAMQTCSQCDYVRWPAAIACPECLNEGGVWTPLSGRGTIWSLAVYEQALHPAFEKWCPYSVALVRLEEGPMIYARMLDPPSVLACEQAVEAVFEEITEEFTVVTFRVVSDAT